MSVRHFIDTQDFSKQELLDILELACQIKAADKEGCTPSLLEGASLAMIFEEPSTRTRVSFEVAMTELGGHALYLKPGEIHLGARESMYDTAKVLSRMCDVIEARTLKHATVTELAKHAEVPVINGLTDYNHPTQVVCDVLTMMEHMPAGKRLEDLNVTFIGDATNVLSSLMLISTRLGMHFTQAAPEKYQAPEEWQAEARRNCQVSGGSLRITDDPVLAVRDADFIYTDLWWWVGQEDQARHGDDPAREIPGRAPQEVVLPDARDRFARRERDRCGDERQHKKGNNGFTHNFLLRSFDLGNSAERQPEANYTCGAAAPPVKINGTTDEHRWTQIRGAQRESYRCSSVFICGCFSYSPHPLTSTPSARMPSMMRCGRM